MMKILRITIYAVGLIYFSLPLAAKSIEPKCGEKQASSELAKLIINHPEQQRTSLQCNDVLSLIAQERAQQLALNPTTYELSPNQAVIQGGFRVPSYYPVVGNQVEAVAIDINNHQDVLQYMTTNTKHQDLVLGVGEFFGLQSQIGVGYYAAENELQNDHWVVIIAEPWQSAKIVFKQDFKTPIIVQKGCEKGWEKSKDPYLFNKCSPKAAKKLLFIQ